MGFVLLHALLLRGRESEHLPSRHRLRRATPIRKRSARAGPRVSTQRSQRRRMLRPLSARGYTPLSEPMNWTDEVSRSRSSSQTSPATPRYPRSGGHAAAQEACESIQSRQRSARRTKAGWRGSGTGVRHPALSTRCRRCGSAGMRSRSRSTEPPRQRWGMAAATRRPHLAPSPRAPASRRVRRGSGLSSQRYLPIVISGSMVRLTRVIWSSGAPRSPAM